MAQNIKSKEKEKTKTKYIIVFCHKFNPEKLTIS